MKNMIERINLEIFKIRIELKKTKSELANHYHDLLKQGTDTR